MLIQLKDIISPQFYKIHNDIKNNNHTHYMLKGGRGSTKSSFISLQIILQLNKDIKANAVILRKYATTIRQSVFAQIVWAINTLGQQDIWNYNVSPAKIINRLTGQQIVFVGTDDPKKMKGIKFSQGYAKVIWYEELDEFTGMNEIRNLNQSLLRGGNSYKVFYSYNPPSSVNSWVNEESLIDRDDRIVHHSSYLYVDKEWLGNQFIIEAEELKRNDETAYKHEYLGEVTGTGGVVFHNITVRTITEVESSQWDKNGYRRGLDFGFAIDPSSYTVCNYDRKKKILYILKDYTQTQLSNKDLAEYMKNDRYNRISVIADSAEPKSISEISSYGISIRGAKKGPDSIEYGIKFLQSLNEIVIDQTCAKTAVKEFCTYEYKRSRDGTFQNTYSDKNNHTIDSIRYALEDDMTNNKILFGGKR